MSLSEFDLIERFFAQRALRRSDVILGIGDDAALLKVPPDQEVAIAMATLGEGTHFAPGANPKSLGHRALAVPLSRLAAMGAEPAWATLALTLSVADEEWLWQFSDGLMSLAARFKVQLVGGDTTRGPLSIAVVVNGLVPAGLHRSGARPGDLVYVTGTLGEAGLAMLAEREEIRLPVQERRKVLRRLERPEPRIEQGLALRGLANAAVDLPDGLAAGLSHLLKASGAGATLYAAHLPVSPLVQSWLDKTLAGDFPLSAGGDYELCFTLPPSRQQEAEVRLSRLETGCTWVGIVEQTPGVRCVRDHGTPIGSS